MNGKQTALITGASGGIGYELAKVFAREGYDLVLVARSEAQLNQVAAELKNKYNAASCVIVKDLTRVDAPQQIFDELAAQQIQVDALVNNAGFATYGPFIKLDMQRELAMMQTNIIALTLLTRLFLPGMVKRRKGLVMNVASTAAFQPGPLMAVYYASKAFVLSFSEAIANEVADQGVKVSALCPGPTETGFQKAAAMEDSKLVKGRKIMDAATVAEMGYKGLVNGQRVVIPGAGNKLGALAARFVPRNMATSIVRGMQERSAH